MVPRAEAEMREEAVNPGAVETVEVVVDSFAKLYCSSQTCRNQQ